SHILITQRDSTAGPKCCAERALKHTVSGRVQEVICVYKCRSTTTAALNSTPAQRTLLSWSTCHQANMSNKNTVVEARTISDLRLVLVGLSGVGKSAAGNIILGRKEFKSGVSCSSLTLTSERREGEVCGRRVTVVDTPGLFNTELSGERLREEMVRCVSLCDPGPHAFLLVVQLGRFTEQEKRVMEELQELFSKRVDQYTVVLFSYGDKLENITIKEFVSHDTNLQKLLKKCSNRYHVFNNKDMENHSQVPELLQKIDKMVEENGGCCYTNDEINDFNGVMTLYSAVAAGVPTGVATGAATGAAVGFVLGGLIGLFVGGPVMVMAAAVGAAAVVGGAAVALARGISETDKNTTP
ncbi:hypothetical protein AAFF_G00390990, partial [Aldrovandia affinis]